jgi:ribosomal protein L9
MIAEAIEKSTGDKIDRRQIDSQPVKTLGVHTAHVRLTVDLLPAITLLVHREGEAPETAYTAEVAAPEEVGEFAELEAELQAEEAEVEAEATAEGDEASPREEPAAEA